MSSLQISEMQRQARTAGSREFQTPTKGASTSRDQSAVAGGEIATYFSHFLQKQKAHEQARDEIIKQIDSHHFSTQQSRNFIVVPNLTST